MAIDLLTALQTEQYDDAQAIVDSLQLQVEEVFAAGDSPAVHHLMGDISKLRRRAEQMQPDWAGLQAMEEMISQLELASDIIMARRQAAQPLPWPTSDIV